MNARPSLRAVAPAAPAEAPASILDDNSRAAYGVEELATALCVSRRTIERRINAGLLVVNRDLGRTLIDSPTTRAWWRRSRVR